MLAAVDPNRIRFPKLGLELTVKSTAFTVFGFSVTWYGILITAGMMLAMLYLFARIRKFGIDSDRATDAIIGGINPTSVNKYLLTTCQVNTVIIPVSTIP
jgi:prolipoprotein diacylglyceryltransferase